MNIFQNIYVCPFKIPAKQAEIICMLKSAGLLADYGSGNFRIRKFDRKNLRNLVPILSICLKTNTQYRYHNIYTICLK